jgi:hypothetical protein
VALSREFHWVEVNRDHAPELAQRFKVHAYPSLITLGRNEEKVHRFSGFKKPEEFLGLLGEALRRHALYAQGKEWDTPRPRPETICDQGRIEAYPAPGEEVPTGLTFLEESLFVAQGKKLFRLDAQTGKVAWSCDLPSSSVRDLCTDGKVLYAMEYGWTAGKPIHVLDPDSGKAVRTIVTEANRANRAFGAAGIAWRKGRLNVLAGMRGIIHEVDPASGVVTRSLQCDVRWLAGLAFDGDHFVAGGREALYLIDTETGKTAREVKTHYPLRAIGHRKRAYYLMEQPVFGHDKNHERVRIWPRKTMIYKVLLDP